MSRSRSSAEKITIDVWIGEHPFPGYSDPIKAMADAFNEAHPEYHVNIEGHDYEAIPAEVVAAVDQGNPPDLAEYYYTSSQTARDTLDRTGKPLFTSIEQAIGGRTEILGEPVLIDDIVPAARGYYTYRGDFAAMPISASTTLLYTNTTLLAAAGLSEPPRTWDEVEAAGKAVAGIHNGPSDGITWPNHGWFFQQALAQQGALLADRDNGRSGRATTVDLASPRMLAYVEWWQRLHREGHYHYGGTQEDWFGCLDAFGGQQVAFLLCSSKLTPEIFAIGQEAGFGVEVSRLPHNDRVPCAGTMVAGQSLWLAGRLDEAKQDGALAFTQYLINPDNAIAWHQAHGQVPITQASFDRLAADGWFDENPQHRVASDQLAAADGSPAALGAQLGDFAGIQAVMTQAMEDVLVRGAEPIARFTAATAEAQRLLDDYNAHCVGGPVRRSPAKLAVR
jgi:sn-glycerol 3-phosphate transport system substrate-binding protein